uniref:Uncharacterized protein n=1 Tax=Romanomermis culicivorax TaxID=13658 RepID=A0A915I7I4_ROMCU
MIIVRYFDDHRKFFENGSDKNCCYQVMMEKILEEAQNSIQHFHTYNDVGLKHVELYKNYTEDYGYLK